MYARGDGVVMDRIIANSVSTRAFCVMTSAIRSRVHFFPTAGTTAGHYPVSCHLTLFGKGIERRSVLLEGGRLNQPDGIRLEDAFPSLANEGSGMYGIEVALECPQGRLDLRNSRAVIEMVPPEFSLSYGAAALKANAENSEEDPNSEVSPSSESVSGIAVEDESVVPSLVIVNSTSELIRPDLRHLLRGAESPLHIGTVAPESAVEFALDESLCKGAQSHETLWGRAVVEKFWGAIPNGDGKVECYILSRDRVSKRPVSVCAL